MVVQWGKKVLLIVSRLKVMVRHKMKLKPRGNHTTDPFEAQDTAKACPNIGMTDAQQAKYREAYKRLKRRSAELEEKHAQELVCLFEEYQQEIAKIENDRS